MAPTPQSIGRAAAADRRKAEAATALASDAATAPARQRRHAEARNKLFRIAHRIDGSDLRALLAAADALGPIHGPAALVAALRLAAAGA